MARTSSTMLDLGTQAPAFKLPDFDGKIHALEDFEESPGLLVVFTCNHCPFVKHIRPEFARYASEYLARGLAIVAINSNDLDAYPQDGPDAMRAEAREFDYQFPYLIDETQLVARSYRAACTPDFFLFDSGRRLVYRGQFDDSRPGSDKPVNGADLRAATDALLSGEPMHGEQRPSLGCNIKWKEEIGPGGSAG
jgi:peroxiredoxin